jgi:hypothetical protein
MEECKAQRMWSMVEVLSGVKDNEWRKLKKRGAAGRFGIKSGREQEREKERELGMHLIFIEDREMNVTLRGVSS